MSKFFIFAFLIVAMGFAGWEVLKKFDPEAADEFNLVFAYTIGRACPPDFAPPDVYMRLNEDCKPVAPMIPGPEIGGVGDKKVIEDTVLTMVNPQAFGTYRQVRIQRRYQPADFPLASQNSIDRNAVRRWLNKQEKEACALLPESFAADCRPMPLSAKLDSDALKSGRPFLTEFQLSYIPAQPIGSITPAETPLVLHTDRTRFQQDGILPLADRVTAATNAALQTCDTTRAAVGNCMVSLIAIQDNGETSIWTSSVSPTAED